MFKLPELPFAYDALEPHISKSTLEFHHDKHHAGYVTKLNAALESHSELMEKSLEDLLSNIDSLPTELQNAVTNNGGQHFNHSLYWDSLSPQKQSPSTKVLELINNSFGSYDEFKKEFATAGASQFGSGWAWLVIDGGKLSIEKTLNAHSPIMHGKKPVLVMDVWEHAYYLDYQNRRPDYINSFIELINWENVEKLIG